MLFFARTHLSSILQLPEKSNQIFVLKNLHYVHDLGRKRNESTVQDTSNLQMMLQATNKLLTSNIWH